MTRLHTIPACYTPSHEDDPEIECVIYFTFSPGQPERGPTYACGGMPAEPAEVELDHVEPSSPDIAAFAADYLQGAGYDRACEQAAQDLMPDTDAAYERMRDDRIARGD